MNEEEFHHDLVQTVAARAGATSDFTDAAFTQVVLEGLNDAGSVADYEACFFKQRGMRLDAYSISESDGNVDVFAADFRGGDSVETLTRASLDQAVRRAEAFVEAALSGNLHNEIEASSPAWAFASWLAQHGGSLSRIRVHVLTDSKLTSTVKELPTAARGQREWVTRIWDLAALQRLLTTGEPDDIVINFEQLFGRPLQCLPANNGEGEVTSYLAAVPGAWLAEIYGRYGGRLLEQNVRTFLQVKGSVNKGIRRTILEAPEMFFAYNNGISATAAEADMVERGETLLLREVKHLQIVNGGQTTASIYNVLKKDRGQNLDAIRVQMKLSVVRPERVAEVVPRISEYANSQNKVSAADFFSNHPFHVRIEEISRRIFAPVTDGAVIQTRWFYERARGQYLNATAYLTPAKKREFELQNPRRQLMQKTDLAKVVMTFMELPHVVSSGAQKNFSKFAEHVSEAWEKSQLDFNEDWFQRAVAMTILFRELEKTVQEADWYSQGFRAQIVTYTLALVQHVLGAKKRALDLERIWQRQAPADAIRDWLLHAAKQVHDRIHESSQSYGISNLTEWCKREKCWDDLKSHVQLSIPGTIADDLVGTDEQAGLRRSARREQRILNGVEAQTAVVTKGPAHWTRLLKWAGDGLVMSPTDMDLLSIASRPRAVPTAAQAERLLRAEQKAIQEGFRP